MVAFNRQSWKLGDYSWRFISRVRQLAAAKAYFSHVRPFATKIANKTQNFCENLLDIHVDNMNILKYFNILSLGLITPNRKYLREVACWGFDNKHLQVSKMCLCFFQSGLNGLF